MCSWFSWTRRAGVALATLGLLSFMPVQKASAGELLTNGGFETGDFTGWSVYGLDGSGMWYTTSDTQSPESFHVTVGSADGTFYAVTDQSGSGTQVLLQYFTVPTLGPDDKVVFSYDIFVNDYSNSGGVVNPSGLSYSLGPNQHVRIDLIDTSDWGPFDAETGVLATFFLGTTTGDNPHPYVHYSFNITSLVSSGNTFVVRFAETNTLGALNFGVDNASVNVSTVPEPGTMVLLATGLAGIAAWRARKQKSA